MKTWNKRNVEDELINDWLTWNKTVNQRTTSSSYCIMVHCHCLSSQRNKCTSQESPKRNCKVLACAQRYTLSKRIRHQSKIIVHAHRKKENVNKQILLLIVIMYSAVVHMYVHVHEISRTRSSLTVLISFARHHCPFVEDVITVVRILHFRNGGACAHCLL